MTTPVTPRTADPAVSVCFTVTIDDQSLGVFNGCEGLGCEVVLEQREEGGNNAFVWQLPSRVKYSTIKLSRPVTRESAQIARWISSVVTGVGEKTGCIKALTLDGDLVAQWDLLDVVPVRWSGPSLSPDSPKVATETIEIAHHGFLPPSGR
ncbi:phage tail protein [Actinomycetospora termitidis]|uniref:Phage tail protein n=1 Tax=Actinomycetospora termitidis TaxID=3053470 RepID=A0ABT7M8Q3_9PSEU|nr:phage tail protein [Actinomycetospora sp. Odt1-22]MDL5156569.1 phage tail protein [Actinomycetospora sp. Odt1-22]